ncbi:MAG: M1 family aminopeptidase [Crocinitomicaceae bacterium]
MKLFRLIVILFTIACNSAIAQLYDGVDFCKSNCSRHSNADLLFRSSELNLESRSLTNNYDLKYHRLEWTVDPDSLFISGTVTSYFVPLIADFSEITFDLTDSLTVSSVIHNGIPITFNTPGNNMINVDLPSVIPLGTLDSVTIVYDGVPANSGFGSFDTSSHDNTPILWTLSEPYGSRDWWPCKQQLTDKIDSIDIHITCPSQYLAVSNGMLIDTNSNGSNITYSWKHRYPIPSYLIAIAITNYDLFIEEVPLNSGDTVFVHNYIYPEDTTMWFNSFSSTYVYMRLFSDLFGDYPFISEKYGHAQFPWGGGMEHQTISFMGAATPGLIAHELGHQWFGDKITCGSWTDIWLNEGFATYLTALTWENYYPQEWQNFKENTLQSITSVPWGSVHVNDTTLVGRIFDYRLSYQKGAMLVHMLRWVLGDSTFYSGLNNYLSDPQLEFAYANTSDLMGHLESSSDKDLSEFFDDWFYGEGYPSYQINAYQNGGLLDVIVNQTTSHPSVSFYEMPIMITAIGDGIDTTYVLQNDQNNQTFQVEVPFKVDEIIFDKDLWILSAFNTVNFEKRSSFLEVYPNPVADQLNINSSEEITTILIYDESGKIIQNLAPAKLFLQIDLSEFSQGMYVVQTSTEYKTEEFKIIKN